MPLGPGLPTHTENIVQKGVSNEKAERYTLRGTFGVVNERFSRFPDARCAADARWTAAVRETLIFIPAPIRLEMFVPIPIRFILIQLSYFHLLLRQLSLPFFILHLLALVQQ